jgi:CheY-like chemotaxis protein
MYRPRLLLAEDHAETAERLRKLLQTEFDVVASVVDGDALVKAAKLLSPDVIVTDIAMPGMDGYAMARDIAARSRGSMPPLVALSAYAGADDVRRSAEAGFAVHLGKPVNYDLLVRTIADLAASARVA